MSQIFEISAEMMLALNFMLALLLGSPNPSIQKGQIRLVQLYKCDLVATQPNSYCMRNPGIILSKSHSILANENYPIRPWKMDVLEEILHEQNGIWKGW